MQGIGNLAPGLSREFLEFVDTAQRSSGIIGSIIKPGALCSFKRDRTILGGEAKLSG